MQTDTLTIVNLILYAVIIVSAFVLKPFARGLDFYFLLGIVISIAVFALPFFHAHWFLWKRLLIALGYFAGSLSVWFVCFLLADYKIMTRLF